MNRIVFDTKIYISSFFWKGASYKSILHTIESNFKIFVSEAIIKEIKRVLARDFNLEEKTIDEFARGILMFADLIEARQKIDFITDDPDDNRILECAVAGKADYIVTQDKHLLKIEEYKDIKIVMPEAFLKR